MLNRFAKGFKGISLFVVVFGVAASGVALSADLAKVNGKAITDKDLKMALGNFSPGQREGILKDVSTRRQILFNLVDQEVLAQEGEKEKMEQDADYKEAMDNFRKQYLASKVLQKNLAPKLTDKAARKHYDLNKLKYTTDQAHALHILLPTEAEAREILKKVKEPNVDFQKVAEERSKDPTAKNNRGDLGFFGRDAMVPEFSDAVFSTAAGEIVGPIKTAYGYHVIKVLEKKTGKPMDYNEVELRVKTDLKQQLVEEYVSKLKKQAKIVVDEKALEKM